MVVGSVFFWERGVVQFRPSKVSPVVYGTPVLHPRHRRLFGRKVPLSSKGKVLPRRLILPLDWTPVVSDSSTRFVLPPPPFAVGPVDLGPGSSNYLWVCCHCCQAATNARWMVGWVHGKAL